MSVDIISYEEEPSKQSSAKSSQSSNATKESENCYESVAHKWLSTPKQFYRGSLLYGNLHGSGIYLYDEAKKIFYNGFFYANKLEGYCQVFYHSSSTYFQGLFKDNKRFGPGVLTYSNGHQDVGLWDGFSLVRVGKSNINIPTLSVTNEGMVKVLKYRSVVDVCPQKCPDIAEEILKSLGAPESLLAKAKELYNTDVKNKNSLFFNKTKYDRYYPEKIPTIEILVDGPRDEEVHQPGAQVDTEEEMQETQILTQKVEMLKCYVDEIEKTLRDIKDEITETDKKIEFCLNCCKADEAEDMRKPTEMSVNEDMKDYNSTVMNFSAMGLDWSMSDIHSTSTLSTVGITKQSSEMPKEESARETYEKEVCECLEEMDIEDLRELEVKQIELKKDEFFYDEIYKHLSAEIEKIEKVLNSKKTVRTKKIVVNQMMAWNNEALLVEMTKHSFVHRNTEYMVNFRVPSVLLGNRLGFMEIGQQEKLCYEYLEHCHSSTPLGVMRYLVDHKINVNVTDFKGNSGMFYAVINNKFEIIRTLIEFGANLDQINDDGVTPLGISILNYLSHKHKISNWETAFLPETTMSQEDQHDIKNWYPSNSFMSVNGLSSAQGLGKKQKHNVSLSSLNAVSCIFTTKFPEYTTECNVEITEETTKEFANITKTITSLIHFGAKTNLGEAPLPTFLMSIYTENYSIVKEFLDNGANSNAVTADERLNALHIIASNRCTEENIFIANLLASYECDPNARTSTTHWQDQKRQLLVNALHMEDIEEDAGKNALHLLCMRTDFPSDCCDFFEKIASLFLNKVDTDATYLGLDALRLAMVAGNLNLVDFLLRSGRFDPYKNVPHEGNVLSMFLADRYKNILSKEAKSKIIKHLVASNVNPLTPFDVYGNVFEFIEQELDTAKSPNELKETLKELAAQTLYKNILLNVSNLLYDFAEEKNLDCESLRPLFKYLTPDSFLDNLKLLFNYDRIGAKRYDKNAMLDVIERVKNKIDRKMSVSSRNVKVFEDVDYDDRIDSMDFRKILLPDKQVILFPPGLDDESKYLVCFECYSKMTQTTFTCPMCEFVHFCDKKCFANNSKRKTQFKHPCQIKAPESKVSEEAIEEKELSLLSEWDRIKTARATKEKKYLARFEKHLHHEKFPSDGKRKVKRHMVSKTTTMVSCLIKKHETKQQLKDLSQKLHRFSAMAKKKFEPTTPMDSTEILFKEMNADVFSGKSVEGKPSEAVAKVTKKAERALKRDISNATGKGDKSGVCKSPCMNVSDILLKYPDTIISSHFEPLPNLKEPYLIRKTRKVPAKPHFFMEMLSKLFPDIHLPEMLLPYTCYSDGGHLYYEFNNTNLFCRNYSIM
ncbi:unnamed protein product [Phyllotreta striolata]|uniref:Ankyrin repeat and MYND domain-containing protein 1 n=1 Tax=Phyllotreta striolata TaxID=444603 RepID=A0A9N9XWF4_PHYSR|nr:unnamed protein product [Phyllotreta striolata]